MNDCLAAPASDLYTSAQTIIWSLVHKMRRLYGTNDEDMWSIANSKFMDAYISYDSKQETSWETWLRTHLLGGMLDFVRNESRRSRILPKDVDYDIDNTPRETSFFSIEDVLLEIGDDAQTIVRLLLQTPEEVRAYVLFYGEHTNGNIRRGLKEYLTDSGWAKKRIGETFREIAEALL